MTLCSHAEHPYMTEDLVRRLRSYPFLPRSLRKQATDRIEWLEEVRNEQADLLDLRTTRIEQLEAVLRGMLDDDDSIYDYRTRARRALES